MLIPSHRHTPEDLDAWDVEERTDALHAQRVDIEKKARAAMEETVRFSANGIGYVGVSWGKDSVVVAHLTWRAGVIIPFVWVRIEGHDNPDCEIVRDTFLSSLRLATYEEIVVTMSDLRERTGRFVDMDPVQAGHRIGFARASARFGERYVSGVRAEESSARKLRTMRWGTTTDRTCAPIARWSDRDVFAYMHLHDLPVHPAYACTMGGIIHRGRVRVAGIGGKRGSGVGRTEWERRYYPEVA